ncbi:hypothetical protein SISNIDRAFT_527526 [Sistotremastrum niveocremeum HHB9708]|uniref:RBR-type E3 ubiquitin transferase n=1 Tax=Sistotremastrum niveocremeum HHB9708 TaxID=1314777 RepID=A0A164Q0Q2_9AGAM|nr:hypothetical protein SISNIDRAFT_527526 [Sistotremastrum niveocremeum HHB9708]
MDLHHVIDFDGDVGQQLQVLNEDEARRASPVQILPEEEPEVLADTPKFSCNVCLDEHPLEDVAVVEGCGHEFCRDCMKDFIESKLSDGQYPVMCPICQASRDIGAPRGYVGRYLIDQLGFTQEQYNKWIELELNQHSMTLECRRCGTSSLVSREDYITAEIFHCPSSECDHVWCKRCGKTIEAAEDDADDDVSHSCDGSTEFARLMSHSGWKACPGCETPIEKTEGCNHITILSSSCNRHFCYKCGETIIRSTDNTEISAAWRAHFSADCPLYGMPVFFGHDSGFLMSF